MADDKRKKKRGRKTKLNLRSCFPSFVPLDERHSSSYCKSNDRDLNNGQRLPKLITVSGCNKNEFITDVEIVNGDRDRDRCSSHRRRISRLFKAVLFDSFMVKKKIIRSSSKSSTASDTSESSSSLSSEKTIKSMNHKNAIRIRESADLDSSLLSSCSRTTSSSNLSSSCCSSSNSNSQWSYEQKTSSSRIDLVDLKLNPVPISSINFTSRSDSLPKPNKTIYPRSLDSSNSLPLRDPNHNQNKRKSSGNNRNNIRWCLFLLLSLVVLVVFGRIYSILCTSTWFYFVPCRSRKMKRVNSVSNNSIKVVDTDSEQYKKRVIMAGLLDRTRDPLR